MNPEHTPNPPNLILETASSFKERNVEAESLIYYIYNIVLGQTWEHENQL